MFRSGKIENFTIPGPQGDIRARAYAPIAAGGEAMPALVYFHGGGFVVGDLDTHDGLCRLLAHEGGFRVIAVEYRLAPEHKWPAPLDDAAAALRLDIRECLRPGRRCGPHRGRRRFGRRHADGLPDPGHEGEGRDRRSPSRCCCFPPPISPAISQSMDKFGVGYFLDRQTIEWNNNQVIPKDADRVFAQNLTFAGQGFFRPAARLHHAGRLRSAA